MYRRIFAGIGIAGIIIASSAVLARPASALTVADLQAQVKELLAKIADLNAQIRAQQATSTDVSVGVSSSIPHRICSVLNRNLGRGSQGDDVKTLQEFLSSEGYLSAQASGYFGPATASAVAKWQSSQGVSAIGSFGPMSRERIKIWCSGGWNKEGRFNASPTRGEAPLTVIFSTWLSGFRIASTYYTIDFGDGTSERAADCPAPADACVSAGENKHTYSANGTYTATLNKITDPCPDDGDPTTPRCLAAVRSEVVGKAQIYVGPQACTKEYKPVCASKQVVCIKAPCNPVQQTYSNRCMMNADSASFLYEGECRSSDGNKPPTISSLSGPTTLSVGETATWNIQAHDPENGTLSYHITWGDEHRYATAGLQAASETFTQTTTSTHSYATAGTYTIIVVVRDSAGAEAKSSTTVRVGATASACTLEYAPVCGRPTGCANTCPPGAYCTMMCRLYDPVTYGNKCQLNAAGAQLLHQGECTATSGQIY